MCGPKNAIVKKDVKPKMAAKKWLTYSDEKEHCELCFQCKSAFLSGFLVSVLLGF